MSKTDDGDSYFEDFLQMCGKLPKDKADIQDLIVETAKKCKEKIQEFDNTKVRCGVIGASGSGKSSLINAIAGEKIAAVGVVETTNDPQDFTHQGIIFTDLPGCGTPKWPKDSYIENLGLGAYDCFLLVTAHRFFDSDAYLFQSLTALGKPCFVIRSMVDRAIEDGIHDNGHNPEETMEIIKEDIQKQLASSRPGRIYLTSARYPSQYDLELLLEDISKTLTGLKRSRFVADMAAYSGESLKKKREVATSLVSWHAGCSALNGLNPIPGLDVAADIAILVKLGHKVAHIYGLTNEQMEYVKRLLGPRAVPSVVTKLAQFGAKYLAEEGVILLVKQISTRIAAKQASKVVPIVGLGISAIVGYKATDMLGAQLVNEAEELAKEVIEGIVHAQTLPGG